MASTGTCQDLGPDSHSILCLGSVLPLERGIPKVGARNAFSWMLTASPRGFRRKDLQQKRGTIAHGLCLSRKVSSEWLRSIWPKHTSQLPWGQARVIDVHLISYYKNFLL